MKYASFQKKRKSQFDLRRMNKKLNEGAGVPQGLSLADDNCRSKLKKRRIPDR
jgi:hypothetical protein